LPQLADILSGAATPWEILPTVDRTLRFRVTARDGRALGGGVDDDEMLVTVAGAPFRITAPAAGAQLECSQPANVTWDVGGGSVAANVRGTISTDGGATFSNLVASTANDGSESLTMPTTLTTTGRIRLDAIGNIFFDISDTFSIVDTVPPTITAPADVAFEADSSCSNCGAPIGTATASDACSVPTITSDAPACFPVGTTTVTWKATDGGNNMATDTQLVTIAVSEPPPAAAIDDTYALRATRNTNEGASPFLAVGAKGAQAFVRFDRDDYDPNRNLQCAPFTATLRLEILDLRHFGAGREVCVHRMLSDWAEGNGWVARKPGPPFRGSGPGATWSCAVDTQIANNAANCAPAWNLQGGAPPYVAAPTSCVTLVDGQTGFVDFPVTADVLAMTGGAGNFGWIVKKKTSDPGEVRFHSREGTGTDPTLIIDVL